MKPEFTNQEIHWRTITTYVDIDTGEIISKAEAIKAYVIINKKKKSNVYKTTGTIELTNECRRSKQGTLF